MRNQLNIADHYFSFASVVKYQPSGLQLNCFMNEPSWSACTLPEQNGTLLDVSSPGAKIGCTRFRVSECQNHHHDL